MIKNRMSSNLAQIDEVPSQEDEYLGKTMQLQNYSDPSVEVVSISDEEVEQPRLNNEVTSNSHNKLIGHTFANVDL